MRNKILTEALQSLIYDQIHSKVKAGKLDKTQMAAHVLAVHNTEVTSATVHTDQGEMDIAPYVVSAVFHVKKAKPGRKKNTPKHMAVILAVKWFHSQNKTMADSYNYAKKHFFYADTRRIKRICQRQKAKPTGNVFYCAKNTRIINIEGAEKTGGGALIFDYGTKIRMDSKKNTMTVTGRAWAWFEGDKTATYGVFRIEASAR